MSDLPTPAAQALSSWLPLSVKGQVLPGPCTGLYLERTKAGWAQGSIYCLSHPSALPGVWDQSPSQNSASETKSPPSCVHSFLSFRVLDSLLQGLCVCVCVVVVCFVLVNEVRFMHVLVNKHIKVFCLSWFVFLVLTAHIIKQPATGQSTPRMGAKRTDRLPERPSLLGKVAIDI